MKSDVLAGFDKVKVAVAYKVDGKTVSHVPYDTYAEVEPVYEEFDGWGDLSGISSYGDLPKSFRDYVEFIERQTGVPVKILSLGPDREQTIIR